MKRILLFFVILLTYVNLSAQKAEKIETDRPGESNAASIVPRHFFQAELGFSKENSGDDYDLYYPDFLLRYGVLKNLELRIEGDVLSEYQQLIPNPKTTAGLKPLEIGGKLQLLEEKGIRPQTSLIAHVGLPFLSTKEFRTPHLSPWLRLAMQNSITDKTELNYNIGAEWDGESTTPAWMYGIEPTFEIGEKWTAFVEAYGFIEKGAAPQHSADAGFTYAVSNNTQLDFSGGVGLSKASVDQFIALGFSFRIPGSKKANHK